MDEEEKGNDINKLPGIGSRIAFRLALGGPMIKGELKHICEDGIYDIQIAPGSALLARYDRLIDLEIIQ